MTNETSNHGYNIPEKGRTDWHLPLNRNFEQIDADIPVWGLDGDKAQYAPDLDSHFFAVDSGIVYEGDGSSWQQIGSVTPSPVYSSDTRSSDKVIVATTADEIQAAIDEFYEGEGSGIVQLLPKTYDVSEQINIRGKVWLRGFAPDDPRSGNGVKTTLAAKNMAAGSAIIHFKEVTEPDKATGAVVSNMGIWGRRKEGEDVHGLDVGFCGHPQISGLWISECRRNGVQFLGTQSGMIQSTHITRCGVAADDTHGMLVGGKTAAGDFNRAAIKGTVEVGNGPTSDSTPFVIRSGGKFRMKAPRSRVGIRVQTNDVPGIVCDSGVLELNDALLTTNLEVGAPGILLVNGGHVTMRETKVEKFDPNLRVKKGTVKAIDCEFRQAKNWRNGGHGVVLDDTNATRDCQFVRCSASQNKGHGWIVPRKPYFYWYDIAADENGGLGLKGHAQMVGFTATENATGAFDGSPKFFALPTKNWDGHANYNRGQTSVVDGDSFSHGLDETPEFVQLETQSSNRAYPANISSSTISVGLESPAGDSISTAEPVLWEAKGPTALF